MHFYCIYPRDTPIISMLHLFLHPKNIRTWYLLRALHSRCLISFQLCLLIDIYCCRSQWSCGLRHLMSLTARTLRSHPGHRYLSAFCACVVLCRKGSHDGHIHRLRFKRITPPEINSVMELARGSNP